LVKLALNEWTDNGENRGMRVNMNKTMVVISRLRQKRTQKAGHVVSVVEVLVVNQYGVLVVRRENTRSVLV